MRSIGLLVLLLAACPHSPSTPVPGASMQAENTKTIAAIAAVCKVVESDPLTVDDLVAAVGALADDPGSGMPINVTPRDSAFLTAQVAFWGEDREPKSVAVELAAPVTLDALRVAFGPERAAPVLHPGQDATLSFYPQPSGPRSCAVLVTAQDGIVSRATVRRD